MKHVSFIAMATLFLFSCKVVEIDKQPIRTDANVTNTTPIPVQVSNFPVGGGTSAVNATVMNETTNPVPVVVTNSQPAPRHESWQTYSSSQGLNPVKLTVPAGETWIVEYINFTTGPGTTNVRIIVWDAGVPEQEFRARYIMKMPANSYSVEAISDRPSLVLTSGQKAHFLAAGNGGGYLPCIVSVRKLH